MIEYNYEITSFSLSYKEHSLFRDPAKTGHLFRGSMPWGLHQTKDRENYSQMLKERQITQAIVLVSDNELNFAKDGEGPSAIEFYQSHAITPIHYPIEDGDVPNNSDTFKNLVNSVIDALKNGKNILVHCMSGRGRTGLLLGCVVKHLLHDTHLDEDTYDILEHLRGQVNGAVETFDQEEYLLNFS